MRRVDLGDNTDSVLPRTSDRRASAFWAGGRRPTPLHAKLDFHEMAELVPNKPARVTDKAFSADRFVRSSVPWPMTGRSVAVRGQVIRSRAGAGLANTIDGSAKVAAGMQAHLSAARQVESVAEADGNRTRQRRSAALTSFEDRRTTSPAFPCNPLSSLPAWSGR